MRMTLNVNMGNYMDAANPVRHGNLLVSCQRGKFLQIAYFKPARSVTLCLNGVHKRQTCHDSIIIRLHQKNIYDVPRFPDFRCNCLQLFEIYPDKSGLKACPNWQAFFVDFRTGVVYFMIANVVLGSNIAL